MLHHVGSKVSTGREGKGREGKGREGKGREGTGRDGKGREGKGREGKGLCLSASTKGKPMDEIHWASLCHSVQHR